jgi:hypothetical protein
MKSTLKSFNESESNTNLKAVINNKLAALNLSDYNAKMIMNRAEAMSCGGCHQNSSNAEIAPNVKWPPSKFFINIATKITNEVNPQTL